MGMEHMQNTAYVALHPFHEDTHHLYVSGTIARNATSLQVAYELRGSLDEILLPLPGTAPQRRNELWQSTCFEFFLGQSGSPQYWEVNLSPSGDWNAYSFTGYRQGMREETAIATLPLTQQRQPTSYQLALDFPLAQFTAPDQPIAVAVALILQGHNGQRAFYALSH
ncbi:MAG: hypothetical protein D3909_14580, partial [Candidatus Electrothrix sp. ATG1]|nr:hypothetical protein [Candidatus Electrothrix sp. ATG1]